MDGFVPTNTLGSMSFDILKLDGIDDPMINVNTLATLDLEESYFTQAVDFIKECNSDITICKMDLYKSISEASEQYVVLESFSEFFTKINDIIDKFIKFIKSLINKFITALYKLIRDDKYITKHKKDFSDFRDADEFKMNGYEYTFRPNIPVANANTHFNKELFADIYDANKGITLDSVKNANTRTDYDDDYDIFRGEILGRDSIITIDEFSTELFKEFRNGSTDMGEIEVGRTKVSQALDRFTNYTKTKTQIESDYKRIERDYDNIKKQVKDITRTNGLNKDAFINRLPDGMTNVETDNMGFVTGDLMLQLDYYVKAKTDQITEYSNIHTLALSAKLDALKESYKQDRALLYTALSKIQRTDARRGK